MLNSGGDSLIPDALECIAAADVFVGSEDAFSRVAAVLSNNVKVLTDSWELDPDEEMVTLHPPNIVADIQTSNVAEELRNVIEHWLGRSRTPAIAST